MNVGDYVLATKYNDGDPCDAFCVGYYLYCDEFGRHHVVDGNGKQFKAGGYRRCECIPNWR